MCRRLKDLLIKERSYLDVAKWKVFYFEIMADGEAGFVNYCPAAGISTDFEKLLTRFTETNSVRYEQFVQIWKEMSMHKIFSGRKYDRECREFTEECLRLAMTYCLPQYQFQVRVCGLYLLYGLYFGHPFVPKVKVRITLEDWKEMMSFLAEIRVMQHLDVEYVFTRLRHDRAFHFVATRQPLHPAMRGGPFPAGDVHQQKLEIFIEKTSALSKIFEPDTIDELSAIHEEYDRHKGSLANVVNHRDSSVMLIHGNLVQSITKSVATHEDWRKEKAAGRKGARRRRMSGHMTSDSEADSEADQLSGASTPTKQSQGAIRAEIKARAFSTSGAAKPGRSRRHRQVIVTDDNLQGVVKNESPNKRGRKRRHFETVSTSHLDGETSTARGAPQEGETETPVLDMPELLPEKKRTKKQIKLEKKMEKKRLKKVKLQEEKNAQKKKKEKNLGEMKKARSKKTDIKVENIEELIEIAARSVNPLTAATQSGEMHSHVELPPIEIIPISVAISADEEQGKDVRASRSEPCLKLARLESPAEFSYDSSENEKKKKKNRGRKSKHVDVRVSKSETLVNVSGKVMKNASTVSLNITKEAESASLEKRIDELPEVSDNLDQNPPVEEIKDDDRGGDVNMVGTKSDSETENEEAGVQISEAKQSPKKAVGKKSKKLEEEKEDMIGSEDEKLGKKKEKSKKSAMSEAKVLEVHGGATGRKKKLICDGLDPVVSPKGRKNKPVCEELDAVVSPKGRKNKPVCEELDAVVSPKGRKNKAVASETDVVAENVNKSKSSAAKSPKLKADVVPGRKSVSKPDEPNEMEVGEASKRGRKKKQVSYEVEAFEVDAIPPQSEKISKDTGKKLGKKASTLNEPAPNVGSEKASKKLQSSDESANSNKRKKKK